MTISNYDDVLDSRDIIERIETLESKLEAFLEENDVLLEENFPEWEELETLRALATECSSLSADWKYGETLIRYNYWESTAENIAQDYSIVAFDDVDYYIRNT